MKKATKRTKLLLTAAIVLIFGTLLLLASCGGETFEEPAELSEIYFVPYDSVLKLNYAESAEVIPLEGTSYDDPVEYLNFKTFEYLDESERTYNNSAGVSYNTSKEGVKISADRAGEFSVRWTPSENPPCHFCLRIYFCEVKTVTTPEELMAMNDPYTIYELGCDIDLAGIEWEPYELYGCFDGKGYTVKNLTVTGEAGQKSLGMFSTVHGAVRNLTLEDASVTVTGNCEYVGLLCGINQGLLTELRITGEVTAADADFVGGVAGVQIGASRGLSVNAEVAGCRAVGGLFGNAVTPKTERQVGLSFAGSVTGYEWVGGIVGAVTDVHNHTKDGSDRVYLDDVKNTGEVSGRYYVGGIVGYAIPDTYTTTTSSGKGGTSTSTHVDRVDLYLDRGINEGAVSGTDYVGGIVGAMNAAEHIVKGSCENRHKVTGVYFVGGIAGEAIGMTLDGFTSSVEVEGHAMVGGIAGNATAVTNSKNTGDITATGTYYDSYGYTGGIVGSVAKVEGCTNTGAIVSNKGCAAGIAGYVSEAVSTCKNEGAVTVSAERVGGVAGHIKNATAESNENTGAVTATSYSVGGVFGYVENSTVKAAASSGTVIGNTQVGGIIGTFGSGSIEGATCTAALVEAKSESADSGRAGGVVGHIFAASKLSSLTSSASVTGCEAVGGVIGRIDCEITIEGLRSTAPSVRGTSYVGGLVGRGEAATLSNSILLNTTVSGGSYVGGLVGHGKGVVSGTFRGTLEIDALTEETEVYVGGIGGRLDYADNCVNYAEVSVPKGRYVGGIAGRLVPHSSGSSYKTINCTNKASVTGGSYVGGIAGSADYAFAELCTNEAAITAESCAGGILGGAQNVKSISNCTNKHDAVITATSCAAGILAKSASTYSSLVTGCRNEAAINCPSELGNILIGD